jgi:hypothetical protein
MNSGYSEDSETLVGWLVYPFLWHCIALVIPSVRRHMKPLGRVQQIGWVAGLLGGKFLGTWCNSAPPTSTRFTTYRWQKGVSARF